MKRTALGEVWWVDLGMAAKIRPALILSEYPEDDELALLIIAPYTTAIRGNRWEINITKPFVKNS
ncbi:MAG: transcriptional modulator of MazE/toxin MazF [Verrucomicrobiales bacterium]|nr:transcriptional modulator of MazE/toxin MazF [Verrucomicrobiales bacterium]